MLTLSSDPLLNYMYIIETKTKNKIICEMNQNQNENSLYT